MFFRIEQVQRVTKQSVNYHSVHAVKEQAGVLFYMLSHVAAERINH